MWGEGMGGAGRGVGCYRTSNIASSTSKLVPFCAANYTIGQVPFSGVYRTILCCQLAFPKLVTLCIPLGAATAT